MPPVLALRVSEHPCGVAVGGASGPKQLCCGTHRPSFLLFFESAFIVARFHFFLRRHGLGAPRHNFEAQLVWSEARDAREAVPRDLEAVPARLLDRLAPFRGACGGAYQSDA